jgi:glycosyltransferase involved in cell wall biosynthesis
MLGSHCAKGDNAAETAIRELLGPYCDASPRGVLDMRGVDVILSETRALPEILAGSCLRTPAFWVSRPIVGSDILDAPIVDPRPALGLPLDATILIYAGRPTKNARVLPTVLNKLRQRRPTQPIALLLVGTQNIDISDWPSVAVELPYIRVVPFLDRSVLFGYLKSADVLVYPGLLDGYPKIVSEAHLAGLPVVAFDSPTSGIREVIEHEIHGLLVTAAEPNRVSADEIERFTAAVERVLDDPQLRTSIVEQGRSAAFEMSPLCFTRRVEQVWFGIRSGQHP